MSSWSSSIGSNCNCNRGKSNLSRMKKNAQPLEEVCEKGHSIMVVLKDIGLTEDEHPQYIATVSVNNEVFVARCVMQTDGWIPKKGEEFLLERQVDGVAEMYFFAHRLNTPNL